MRFAPTRGTCDGRNGRYNHCGATNIFIACKSRGQCIYCSNAYKSKQKISEQARKYGKTRIVKKELEKLALIKKRREYYSGAIRENEKENMGVCRCDECKEPISHPSGKNVCHIVGDGANLTLYFHPKNRFILGKGALFHECECGNKFDDQGKKSEMKIYPRYVAIRTELNRLYYVGEEAISEN